MTGKLYKIACLLLAFCLLFCACTSKTDTPDEGEQAPSQNGETVVGKEIILPYAQTDSLNPFFVTGMENNALTDLAYQPLFRVLADYTPENVLASAYEFGENEITVTLQDVTFSDGSAVTARDVVYSFQKAKTSSLYAPSLENITDAKQNGNKVSFKLASPDIYVQNILTFPIVKHGTAEEATSLPIGSGTYVYADGIFTCREDKKADVNIQTIKLYNITDLEHAPNALEIGNVNFLFDDFSEGEYQRVEAENMTVPMNYFVFLGMNNGNGALTSSAVRTAIYYAIHREAIVSSAYRGYANAATSLFHPNFVGLKEIDLPPENGDRMKAEKILEKSGFTRYNKMGIRTDGVTDLRLSILVNSENAFRVSAAQNIAEKLNALGMTVSVESVPQATYFARIAAGDFQLYIGEIRLTDNMDFSCFFTDGKSAAVGIDKSLKVCAAYNDFRAGNIGMQDFVNQFMNDIPLVPLCYRSGLASYKKEITPNFAHAASFIYADLAKWDVKA